MARHSLNHTHLNSSQPLQPRRLPTLLPLLLTELHTPLRQQQARTNTIDPHTRRQNSRQTLTEMNRRRFSDRIRQTAATGLDPRHTRRRDKRALALDQLLVRRVRQP